MSFCLDMQTIPDNLMKLSPDDAAAKDFQLMLVAVFSLNFTRLSDDVPMGCRLLLLSEVRLYAYIKDAKPVQPSG